MVNGNAFENINTEWRLLSELPVNKFSKDLELEELVQELSTYLCTCKNALGEKCFQIYMNF
jgi:hypothetical protein